MIALGAVLVPLAVACRWHFGSWAAPACFFVSFWAVAVLAPLALAPEFETSIAAVGFVVAVCVAVGVGGVLAMPRDDVASSPAATVSVRSRRPLAALSVTGTLAGFTAAMYTLTVGGFSVSAVLSLGGLLEAGNAITVQRYSESGPTGTLVPLLLVLVYAATSAAPFIQLAGTRSRALIYGPLLGATSLSLVSTERLVMLTGAALTVGAELTVLLVRRGSLRRAALRLLVGALAVAVLFAGIAFVRVGRADSATVPVIAVKLKSYAFGYLAAYSQWYDEYRGLRNAVPTAEPTAFAPLDLLSPARDVGATRGYEDARRLGSDGETNIFTVLRPLVVELGRAGTLAFFVLVGFVATRWHRAVRRRTAVAAWPALAGFYAATLLSSTQSLFGFSTVCAAVLLGALTVTVAVSSATSPRPAVIRERPASPPAGIAR